MHHNFVGIDTSKNEFYVRIYGSSKVAEFDNTLAVFRIFKKSNLPILRNVLTVIEAT